MMSTGAAGSLVRTRYRLSQRFHESRARFSSSWLMGWRYAPLVSDRLLIAPQDLRTADAIMGQEFGSGRFVLANVLVEAGRDSPFAITVEDAAWTEALHGFSWLRHFRAVESDAARAQAVQLVADWLDFGRSDERVSWRIDIAAERVIAWLCHSPMLIANADIQFYKRFVRSLMREARLVHHLTPQIADGMPRLTAAVACTMAGLSFAGHKRFLRSASRRLERELQRQVLPDGGHISRSPSAILDILSWLLPIRQCFNARTIEPPREVLSAIDRMMPMLRFFRHPNGVVANFNGTRPFPPDLVAKVLAYDDVRGAPVQNASHSGYQRIERGKTVVLVDSGGPPPFPVSGRAHAGALSLEVSDGGQRLIVNCGATPYLRQKWFALARSTAAHSTLSIDSVSSLRFLNEEGGAIGPDGNPVVEGPSSVTVKRGTKDGSTHLFMTHDGYGAPLGLMHQRDLVVTPDGETITGEDVVSIAPGHAPARNRTHRLSVRFHLHPLARAVMISPTSVFIILGPGRAWLFETEGDEALLEDSVFLSDLDGPKRTLQIVLSSVWPEHQRFNWHLRRITDPVELANLLARMPQAELGGE